MKEPLLDMNNLSDNSVIGEIKRVPKSINPFGYIDYIEGDRYSTTLYPGLYEVLKTDVFPKLANFETPEELPVGSILHTLNASKVPNGYALWECIPGNLRGTEILKVFTDIYNSLPYLNPFRSKWKEAVDLETFPNVPADYFLKVITSASNIELGEYTEETYNANAFNNVSFSTLPIVRSLSEGGTSHTVDSSIIASSTTMDKLPSTTEAQSALLGVNLTKRKADLSTQEVLALDSYNNNVLSSHVNKSSATEPYNLKVKLLVKVNSTISQNDDSFKYVIKAFNFIDMSVKEIPLAVKNMVDYYQSTKDDFDTVKAKVKSLKSEIDVIETETLPNKIEELVSTLTEKSINKNKEVLQNIVPNLQSSLDSFDNSLKLKITNKLDSLNLKFKAYEDKMCCISNKTIELLGPLSKAFDEIKRDKNGLFKELTKEYLTEKTIFINNSISDILAKVNANKTALDNVLNESIKDIKEKQKTDFAQFEANLNKAKDDLKNIINLYASDLYTLKIELPKEIEAVNTLVLELTQEKDKLVQRVSNIENTQTEILKEIEKLKLKKDRLINTDLVPAVIENENITTVRYGGLSELLGSPDLWVKDTKSGLLIPLYRPEGE